MESGDYFRSIPNLLTPRGLMILGQAGQETDFAHDIATMDLARITMDQALAIVPILNPETVQDIGYGDHAWDIDTDLLLQGFARTARSHGAEIVINARATQIDKIGDRWRVTTASGAYEAAVLINAAGAWADPVAQMAGIAPLGIQPLRRSMARIPAPGGHDLSSWPMIFGCGETWYCKPDAGALIVSPADEDPMPPHDAFADDLVLAMGLARYEEMVTEPVTRMIANWAGLRSFAPDRVPVIGFDAHDPTFFWLAGQGGYGFQSSDGASRLAAALVLGERGGFSPQLSAALNPARFK
jgi:glycine/D-amino acid oxidase-like deaminating enzyme